MDVIRRFDAQHLLSLSALEHLTIDGGYHYSYRKKGGPQHPSDSLICGVGRASVEESLLSFDRDEYGV